MNWTVAEAKSKLSEVLRRASEEGPQTIGRRTPYVVVTREEWDRVRESELEPGPQACPEDDRTLGQWLVANMPREGEIELPDRKEPDTRYIPFSDEFEE